MTHFPELGKRNVPSLKKTKTGAFLFLFFGWDRPHARRTGLSG